MPHREPEPERPLRVARLVRVSTTHVEQADSPQHQLAFIDGEIGRAGWADTGLVYQAELTGAVIVHRPEIQRMLADAGGGRFQALVLKSISRLGRDTLGLLMVKRLLDDLQVELIALADGYRSGRDPELIFLVHAERAQAGRQEISKNVRAGIVEAARRGIWPAGTVPFGLRRQGRFQIDVDPETGPLVQLIFQLRSRHWGLTQICCHLNRDLRVKAPTWWQLRDRIRRLGVGEGADRDPRIRERLAHLRERLLTGRFAWTPRTVRLLLQNPAYTGTLQYNRTTGQRRLHGRLVRVARDPADWVTVPCAPLVGQEDWAAAQAAAATRRRLPRRALGSVWLLAGLVRCGRCGTAMRALPARGNTGRRGGELRGYYVCRGSLESGLHRAEYIRASALEAAILARLRTALAGLALPAVEGGRSRAPDAAQVRAGLRAELADLAEARCYRREELRRGHMTRTEFETERAILRRREAELQARLERLEDRGRVEPGGAPVGAGTAERRAAREAAARLLRLEGPEQEIKALLPLLVREVVVQSAGEVELHATFAPDEVR